MFDLNLITRIPVVDQTQPCVFILIDSFAVVAVILKVGHIWRKLFVCKFQFLKYLLSASTRYPENV